MTVAPPLFTVPPYGMGTVYTTVPPIAVMGSVSPLSLVAGITVTGQTGTQTVSTFPNFDGSFSLPPLNLAIGLNTITVNARHTSGGTGPPPPPQGILHKGPPLPPNLGGAAASGNAAGPGLSRRASPPHPLGLGASGQ